MAMGGAPVTLVNADGTAISLPTAAGQTATNTLIGAVTETAPASDTASSGLNGRLQRIAQRLTSLIALLPASLGIKTAAGSLSFAPASDAIFAVAGDIAHDAVDSGNPVKIGGFATSTAAANVAVGDRVNARFSRAGELGVFPASTSSAGADAVTNTPVVAVDANANVIRHYTRPELFNGSTWDRSRGDTNGAYVVAKPATTGGLTPARVLSGTTGVIKNAAGQLYSLMSVQNTNAAVRYLHLYDKATAPTLSTDTPVLTISLAASSVQNNIDLTAIGVAFATGISWAYTTDNIAIPTTAGTSTELMFSAAYK